MTKIYEDFIRGEVESIKIPSEILKGEFTVVISKEKYTKNIENNIDESVKINIKKIFFRAQSSQCKTGLLPIS